MTRDELLILLELAFTDVERLLLHSTSNN